MNGLIIPGLRPLAGAYGRRVRKDQFFFIFFSYLRMTALL